MASRVLLAGGAVARAQPLQVEPRVALQELDEMLAHHAGGAENAYFDSRLHKCLYHSLIDFHCFEQLLFGHALFQRVRHVDGARAR